MSVAPRSRWRKLVSHVLAALLSTTLFLGGLEVVLRAAPGWIGPGLGELGNDVYSAYGAFAGGIYVYDEKLNMNFMRPGFETVNYWNGYFWHHRTDRWGYRNPPELEDRSILLLGDSFIYGHGVEEEVTVAHLLRSEYGRPAYNMARQGDCLYQNYLLLRLDLDRFEPRDVVLFVFLNDFYDLTFYRTTEQIEEAPEIDRYRYEEIAARREALQRGDDEPWRKQLYRSRALRLLLGTWRGFGRMSFMATAEAAPRRFRPLPYLETLLDWEAVERIGGYYRRILPDLDRRCRQRGARLTVVFLDFRRRMGSAARKGHRRIDNILNEISRGSHIPYVTTRGLFENCPGCFLPNDGHLSAEGHRRLAAFVDRRVLPPAADRSEP